MFTSNTSFSINCYGGVEKYVDLRATPINILNIYTPYNSEVILEITIVTYTLSSNKELGSYQKFVKQNQTVISKLQHNDLTKIGYSSQSLKSKNEPTLVVKELYDYLFNYTYCGNIFILASPKHAEFFEKLFNDAGFQLPQIINFVSIDLLVKNALKCFNKHCLDEKVIDIGKNNKQVPRQKTCQYHSNNKRQTCFTGIIRKNAYIIHAVLKQCGLDIEGNYVSLNFKQTNHLQNFNSKHNSNPTLSPIPDFSNILTPEFRNIFDEYFPNFCVHFIDFEFAYTKDNFNQINEIGISSYDLLGNNELSWYHALIHPGDYKDIMKGPIQIHGIDPRNRCIPFKNISDVKNELKAYFNKYQGLKFLCVKDEEVNRGDYNCLKELMGIIPNDVCVITHIELFEMICNHYNVELPEEHSIVLNKTFKQLKIRQRCSFHETTEKHYHCGLGDSRATALMIMIEMKNAGILINNEEELPIVKRIPNTFNINTNNFLFINVDKYSNSQVSEILMTKVTFNNYQIQTCNTSTFQYLLPEDDLQSPEQSIIQNFFTQNNYPSNTMIYEHLQSIIDSGDDNQVIVFLDGSLTRIIHKLSFDAYLFIPKNKFLEQFISEINGGLEYLNYGYVLGYIQSLVLEDSNVKCTLLHQENHNKCSHWKFNNFKNTIEPLCVDYTTIIQECNTAYEQEQIKIKKASILK